MSDASVVELLRAAIKAVDDPYATDESLEREVSVLTGRHFTEPRETLRQLGERFGVGKERIRQIEARAHRRLRRTLANPAVAVAMSTIVEQHEAFARDVFGLMDESERAEFAKKLREKAERHPAEGE